MFDELDRVIIEASQLIFNAGDEGDCAYLIEEGAVEIFVMDQDRECRIGFMGKGEMFGEVSLIDYRPRTATVRTVERTILVPITRELMESLLNRSDPILRHFLLIILDRFRSNRGGPVEPAVSAEASPVNANRRSVLKGEVTQKISLVHGMSRALKHDEFQLHYQPICDLFDGSIAGFEALIRWNHPIDGLMPPLDFLWIAEQTGQIREIGLWTLERACKDWPLLKSLTDHGTPFVSVNLSASQLINERLVEDVKSILESNGMNPAEMKLELTETVMVSHPEVALKIFNRLIELGSSLALDDYGTGHSGLGHIQQYPIGTLKIDRVFIAPVLDSAQNMEIVRSSIALAHSLGMNVVAEGVENAEVGTKLMEMGCDFGQGWYFGRPATLQDLLVRYAKN
jgi:EAL domain-containing protein (putative c-di-GMP-specific phosphodiesterase class I)